MNTKEIRLIQILLTAVFALFFTTDFFENLMNHQSKIELVGEILAKNPVHENGSGETSISSEFVRVSAFLIIGFLELLIALLGWFSVLKMLLNFRVSAYEYSKYKRLGFYAYILAILLWFTGFIFYGTHWFDFWEKLRWGGSKFVINLIAITGIFLIIFLIPEYKFSPEEIERDKKSRRKRRKSRRHNHPQLRSSNHKSGSKSNSSED